MAIKPTKTGANPVTTAQTTIATQNDTIDWGSYAGSSGFESVSQSDLGVPFLTILQTKSAEVDKTHKDYPTKRIEGAEAGDIINTVTRKIVAKCDKETILVIPAFYEKTYCEWKLNRGGLVKVHRNPAIVNEVTGKTDKGEGILRNGNLLVETASFYVHVKIDGVYTPAVINMISTQLKNARLWLNLALGIKVGPNRVTPPLFSHHYQLCSVLERKDNNSWYGWKIVIADIVNDRELVKKGADMAAKMVAANRPVSQIAAPASPEDDGHGSDDVPM